MDTATNPKRQLIAMGRLPDGTLSVLLPKAEWDLGHDARVALAGIASYLVAYGRDVAEGNTEMAEWTLERIRMEVDRYAPDLIQRSVESLRQLPSPESDSEQARRLA